MIEKGEAFLKGFAFFVHWRWLSLEVLRVGHTWPQSVLHWSISWQKAYSFNRIVTVPPVLFSKRSFQLSLSI